MLAISRCINGGYGPTITGVPVIFLGMEIAVLAASEKAKSIIFVRLRVAIRL
jgi:hypothetical protein